MKQCVICGELFEPVRAWQKVCKKRSYFMALKAINSKKHYEANRKPSKIVRECPDCDGELTQPYVTTNEGAVMLVGGIFKSARQCKDAAFFHGKEARFYYDTAGVNMADLELENVYQLELA